MFLSLLFDRWETGMEKVLTQMPLLLKMYIAPWCPSERSHTLQRLSTLKATQSSNLKGQWICSSIRKVSISKHHVQAPLVAQSVKNPPARQETRVRSPGQEDPLQEGMATHSCILAWKTPWTERPGEPQSIGSQRVGHDLATKPNYTMCSKLIAKMKQGSLWPSST